MVQEVKPGVEMVQRNMMAALRHAMALLGDAEFAAARDMALPWADHPSGALLHAITRAGAGDVAEGAAAMTRIADANPTARHPVHDLIEILQRHNRLDEAVAHLRAALKYRPSDAALLVLLGRALAEHGSMAEAGEIFRKVAERTPVNAAAMSNWGKSLAAQNRFDDAEQAFATATRLAPTDKQLILNRAVAMLKSGRWTEGWPMFRARHALPGRPVWLPGPELMQLDQVSGRKILLVHSEGFGDTLQFIRYAPLIAERGATVLASVPPPLVRLLQRMPELHIVGGDLPPYDAWCRISDLPALFAATPPVFPAPYRTSMQTRT